MCPPGVWTLLYLYLGNRSSTGKRERWMGDCWGRLVLRKDARAEGGFITQVGWGRGWHRLLKKHFLFVSVAPLYISLRRSCAHTLALFHTHQAKFSPLLWQRWSPQVPLAAPPLSPVKGVSMYVWVNTHTHINKAGVHNWHVLLLNSLISRLVKRPLVRWLIVHCSYDFRFDSCAFPMASQWSLWFISRDYYIFICHVVILKARVRSRTGCPLAQACSNSLCPLPFQCPLRPRLCSFKHTVAKCFKPFSNRWQKCAFLIGYVSVGPPCFNPFGAKWTWPRAPASPDLPGPGWLWLCWMALLSTLWSLGAVRLTSGGDLCEPWRLQPSNSPHSVPQAPRSAAAGPGSD